MDRKEGEIKKTNDEGKDIIQRKGKGKVYLAAVTFSTIVGFSFLGVKTALASASALETLAYRFNFAFLAICLPVVFGWVKIRMAGRVKKKLLITAGFYIAFMLFQVVGLIFSTSIESGIIFAIIPILAKLIAGVVLKETSTWKQNAFVCLSVAAVIAMFVQSATNFSVNLVGLFILLISSLCMAISNVLMRYVREEFKPVEISFFIAFGGWLLFNLMAVIAGWRTGTLFHYGQLLTDIPFLISTAYLGILSTLISALLMSYMLANMEAIKATIFGNLSTAISIVAGVVFLGEPLESYHIICTLLIVVGVIGVSMPAAGGKTNG